MTAGKSQQSFSGAVMLDRAQHLVSGQLDPVKIQGKDLSNLLPLKEKTAIGIKSGVVSASGTFAHDYHQLPAQVTGSLSLKAENIAGTWKDYPYEGMAGAIQLTRLFPWETAKDQVISVKLIGTGVNLTDGKIQFQGSKESGYTINSAAFNFAGGTLSTSPFAWKPDEKNNSLTLQLQDIGLAQLAQSMNLSGFAAQGSLEGSLPIVFSPKGLVFKEGLIKSSSEGVFKYSPASYPPALQGNDTRMETVRRALSDFHYNTLEVSVGGALNGNLKTTLKATGKNPIFGNRPINLNINLQGALMPVLQQALQPGRISDSIEKSITGDEQ